MNREQLVEQIRKKRNYLCVGLDTDIRQIPAHLVETSANPVLEFNRQIIEATQEHCVAYKINTAFYEALGKKGWELMEETLKLIPSTHFSIADAKRGDIGNTSSMYARAFFDPASSGLNFDAITAAPYMGRDSLEPFFAFAGKWVIVLGLTSNPGSADFEQLDCGGEKLYERVIRQFSTLGNTGNLMFVTGATKAEMLADIRKIIPDHFLLVPGVGSQGGDLAQVSAHGFNREVGLLVNASRSIIYAGKGKDFAQQAAAEAAALAADMRELMQQHQIMSG